MNTNRTEIQGLIRDLNAEINWLEARHHSIRTSSTLRTNYRELQALQAELRAL
jgi:hypothetical protein